MKKFLLTPMLFWGVVCQGANSAEMEVGSVPPDFTTKNGVTGERIHLAEKTGKVVVLTFWASWCGPCRRELPILGGLSKQVSKDKLEVLAVSFQENEGVFRVLKKSAGDWGITLIEDAPGKIGRLYGIKSIPHMYIIGKDGKVAAVHVGYGEGSVNDVIADINAALTQQISSTSE